MFAGLRAGQSLKHNRYFWTIHKTSSKGRSIPFVAGRVREPASATATVRCDIRAQLGEHFHEMT
jgi:hypothetical protein